MRTIIRKATHKGFTLVELMISFAIVAILAAYTVPADQTYVVRVQLSESFVLTEGAKATEEESYSTR